MYKLIEIVDTGKTEQGHAAYDYLIEQTDTGERRWLRECISFDEESMNDEDCFSEEDWEELELVK